MHKYTVEQVALWVCPLVIPSDTVNDVYYQLKTNGKVSRGG